MLFVDYFLGRMYYVDDPTVADLVLGYGMILLALEATRRSVGLALPLTAATFILYALTVGEQSPLILIDQLYLTTEGIFGIPVGVSATYVILFIIFGALVERTGAGQLFMDVALALAGHQAGGPAKVACLSSGLFGTVSGSAVANVMTTGTFTIPLMRKIGYRPAFAGAVEAVASTGGQIMPPIMGAAAFVMAEFLGVSYLHVATAAAIPAVLYFLAVFVAVHFEAKRTGLKGLPRADLPRLGLVLKERGHLFLPLVIIIWVLVDGYSAQFAALCGIASVVPSALLRRSTRAGITVRLVVEGLIAGARNTVTVALACACAGIVVGVVTLTGLGLAFTSVVLAAAQNTLILALVLTMARGYHPRHGHADHARLHRPGGAAGAGHRPAGRSRSRRRTCSPSTSPSCRRSRRRWRLRSTPPTASRAARSGRPASRRSSSARPATSSPSCSCSAPRC